MNRKIKIINNENVSFDADRLVEFLSGIKGIKGKHPLHEITDFVATDIRQDSSIDVGAKERTVIFEVW